MAFLKKEIQDLTETIQKAYVWKTISIFEIKARYRRTAIGPFWLTLGTAITIFGMGLVWASIFGLDLSQFLPYVASGMVMWFFLSSVILEGCTVFVSQASIIHNIKLPFFFYIFVMLSRNFIILLHNIIVIVLVFILFKHPISWPILLFLPGIGLIMINLFWISIVIGIFSTRYRDIAPIIGSILTLLMMVTPIMWKQDMLKGPRSYIATLNPFTHLIDIVRDPLLGKIPSYITYGCVIGMTVLGLMWAFLLYSKYRNRIAYWL